MFGRKRRNVISLQVIDYKCIGCESCVDRCRRRVLKMVDEIGRSYAGVAYPNDCVGCGKCLNVCPVGAIELVTES